MAKRRAFGSVEQRPPRPGHYVAFHWQGRRYRRAVGPSKKVAQQKLSAAHVLLEGGTPIGEVLAEVFGDETGGRLTFRQAAPLYLEYAEGRKKASTFKQDTIRLRAILRAAWTGNYLSAIGPEDITRFAEQRRKAGASGPTVNRDLALISALFKWAVRLGYVADNPTRKVERFSEKGRERETYLTADESRALVKTAGPPLAPLLVAALSTGMRRGELLALKWRDIDWKRDEIVIRAETEKTGQGRVIPMTLDLRQTLRDMRGNLTKLDGDAPVFTLLDGSPLRARALRTLFTSAVGRCDTIPEAKRGKVTLHVLRHTAASLMVQAGVSIPEVGKILGHATLQVTMRYSHFAPEAGRNAVDRLGEALGLGALAGAQKRQTGTC